MHYNFLKSSIAFLSVSTFLLFFSADAQTKKKKIKPTDSNQYLILKQLADADSVRLVDIYKDLHQHPELAFTETRTAGIVAKELKELGYEVFTGIGKTGSRSRRS
jgi:hippurate hydrolase